MDLNGLSRYCFIILNTSKIQNYDGLLPPATRFITTVCVTTNDENLRPGS